MPIPGTIPTVKVRGTYFGPDGRSLLGTITFTIPALLTFPDSDLFIAGPVVAQLDENGHFEVTLPATDAPGMNPSGWSYTVKENLTGVVGTRTFAMLLPKDTPGGIIDLADVAPADPTTPTYVPVAGSQILWGTAAPTAGLGVNSDFYVQYDTRTLLGITHTTVTNWKKTGGTWATVGGVVRGSQIYLNTTSTPSTDAKAGDLLIRTDTGDMWQREASSWGSVKGNIKGPKGDKGDTGTTGAQGIQGIQGVKGDKGDPGNGNVNTVNTKVGPDIVLNAADVGALGATGTTLNVATTFKGNGTNAPLNVYGDNVAATRFTVLKDGSWYSNALANSAYNMAVGDTTSDFAGGTFVLALKNANVVPTTNPTNGVVAYAEGGVMKVRQTNGTIVTVGNAALNGPQVIKGDATATDPLKVQNDVSADLFAVRKTGSARMALGNLYVDKNLRVGGSGSAAGVGSTVNGVLAIDNGTGPSAANTAGVHLYAEAGQLKVQEQSGNTFTVGGARNTWTPQALGFQAWSVDPATVANPTGTPKAAVIGRIYFSGMNITEPTVVDAVCVMARGWGGSTLIPAARFYAGIYNEAGTRVATSGLVSSLPAAGQLTGTAPGAKDNHVGAVPVNLTAPITLQPGRYWAAFLVSAGSATDFYYMHIQNEAPSNPANFYVGTTFQRHWCIASGQTSLPATVNQATGEVGLDPAIMALANL
ncbi:hypothetical protein [Streptomyces sp. NBC_01244]|uniref:hypothetical protein n=1 Tax=Streptomyces sp. NBC_01244 TaxID=2903797 RepID=UPI002E11BC7A|nr:hypothetical protein OG247_17860 [Streptomyces sp. NBC_01244]